jgi:Porin PorA
MRRRVGYLLVFVGLFLVFFALMVRFYAYARLQKVPLSHYSQTVATGEGRYFNRAQLKVVPARLKNIRTARGDPQAGSSDTAVWDTFSAVMDLGDNGVLAATQERIAMDRVTGEPRRCCGEQPAHSGLTVKFPFHTQKRSYSLWDATAKRAFPAGYAREERVEDLDVYRFEQRLSGVALQRVSIGGEQAGQPNLASVSATVTYGSVKTLWVEPRTGIIVKAGQRVDQTLRTDDGRAVLTVLRAELVFDDNSVRRNVEDARNAASRLRMLQWVLPLCGLALGVVLCAVGVTLVTRQIAGPRSAGQEVPAPSAADAR